MSRTTHQVYKFEPGQCVCLLGDPGAGARRINVRKLGGEEAVLDPDIPLQVNRYVYATIKLQDGPSFVLNGLVVTSASGGILIQWSHSSPREVDRIDTILRAYVNSRQAAAAPSAHAAPPAATPSRAADPAGTAARAPSAPKAPAAASTAVTSARTAASPSSAPAAMVTATPPAPAAPPPPAAQAAPPAARPSNKTAGVLPAAEAPHPVDAKLRQKAKRVRASDLASRVETVQIINTSMIRSLIQEGVDEAVALHASQLADADRKRLLEEAEASFAERLSLFKAEKSGLETQIHTLQDSLKKAQGLLDEERVKVLSANQFTVSDAGMVELEQRLGRLLERALKAGHVAPELAEDMRAVVIKLLDDERAKIHDQAQQAQSDRLQLLERKVQRLASSLENAEAERDLARERAQALEAAGGSLRNVLQAGLHADDPQRSRKLGLLKEIFKLNQEIRQKLAAEGRMPAYTPGSISGPADRAAAGEARVAKDLGIERQSIAAGDGARAGDAPVAEREGAEASHEEAVPVLASGLEADPDDLPWEPPEEAGTATESSVNFKRLGSGT